MSPTRIFSAVALVALLTTPALAQTPATAPLASMTSKPVTVQGDLVDTLKLSGQFTIFVGGIDSTNLAGLLKSNKNLTVFAPIDAAFTSMPPADLAKLKSDKTAMQKFVLHHVVNAPVDSTKIKGVKGPIPSGAQDQILLDGSDPTGVLKVDGATIVQADIRTGSGLLHVVDHVLIAGQGAVEPVAATTGEAALAAARPDPAGGTKANP